MKRYPAYKDSGVEWFEKLPSSWGLKKLKHISEVINGSTPKSGIEEYWNGDIVWITPNDLGHSNGLTVKDSLKKITTKGLNSCGTSLTPPGSIILSTRAPIGHIALTSVETCTNQGCKTVVPNNEGCYNRFLFYYLLSSKLNLQSLGQGSTFSELSSQNLKDFKSPFPSNEEQKTIAKYLNHKTNLIDTLIEKKQKQIGLLQEQRAAIINHAVTKGLNPNVKMKDSGVEWLGEVPEHWTISSTKYVADQRTGHTPSRQQPEYWVDCTIPWFTLADVWQLRDGRKEYVEQTKERISKFGLDNSSAELLPTGTVIVSRTASVGFSGIMAVPMATTQDYINWVCGPKLKPEYLLYVFRCMKQEFMRLTMGSTHKTIYMPDARSFRTPVPPLEEQEKIVEFIRQKIKKLWEIEDGLKKSVENFKEYRTTLISEVVTGKIDVRDEAIP